MLIFLILKKLKTENYIKHIGYILFQNPQPLPTLNNTCYNTITMKNKTTYKPNITVFVGRSEQSDLQHLTFCRTYLRQIAKNKRYSFSSSFLHSKPVKTTHKPSLVQQPDHNTVKIQSCEKRHKTVSFLNGGNTTIRRSERAKRPPISYILSKRPPIEYYTISNI